MERLTIGIVAFPILFSLLVIRVPIGLAMLIVGAVGTAIFRLDASICSDEDQRLALVFKLLFVGHSTFFLMGNFATGWYERIII